MFKNVFKQVAILLMSCVCVYSWAQTYPTKSIRLVVPMEPGSPTDAIARLIAQKLTSSLGQSVVVDNRASVNGIIGTDMVAHAPADGYTLLAGNSGTHAMNPGLYKKLNYDPVKDFEAVAQIVTSPLVLMGSKHFAAHTVAETIAAAKHGSLHFAIPGATAQLASLMFNSMASVDIVSIPYKGSSGAETALLSGDAQLLFASISNALPYVKSGRMNAIAVSSPKRSPALPDVPTLNESGVPGFEIEYWVGLFAPAGTPAAIVDRLNSEVGKVLGSANVRDHIQQMGYSTAPNIKAEFGMYVKRSVERNTKLMRELGVVAQ